MYAQPGDIYVNRYPAIPLYYLITEGMGSKMIPIEVVKEWLTGGLMKNPTPVPPTILPSQRYWTAGKENASEESNRLPTSGDLPF
jgi:hypothetical protein